MFERKKVNKAGAFIISALAFAAISSISLSLIPLTNGVEKEKDNTLAFIIASVFWGGLILMAISEILAAGTLRGYRAELIKKGYIKKHQQTGLISISKDPKMWVVYALFIVGLAVSITDIIIDYVPEVVMFPIVSLTVLSFAVHCIVDGKYFKAYRQIKEIMKNGKNRKV